MFKVVYLTFFLVYLTFPYFPVLIFTAIGRSFTPRINGIKFGIISTILSNPGCRIFVQLVNEVLFKGSKRHRLLLFVKYIIDSISDACI